MTENEKIEIAISCATREYCEGCPAYENEADCKEVATTAISALKEIQQYREIGTVEECREAVEKQKPKKPLGGVDIAGNEYMICSYCSAIVEDGGWRADYCPDCGQAIKWDENLEGMEDGKTESN